MKYYACGSHVFVLNSDALINKHIFPLLMRCLILDWFSFLCKGLGRAFFFLGTLRIFLFFVFWDFISMHWITSMFCSFYLNEKFSANTFWIISYVFLNEKRSHMTEDLVLSLCFSIIHSSIFSFPFCCLFGSGPGR